VARSSPPAAIAEALTIATAHHQAGRLVEAEQIYRQILQQQQQVDALNLLGVIACQRGNLEEGIVLYRQALALRPGHLGARENLYLALWKQGKQWMEEAIAGYTQMVTFQPKDSQAYSNLITILLDQRKLDEALAYCQQGLTVQPANPQILNYTGMILQRQGKSASAIPYHQQAIALQPDYADAHTSLGIAYMDQGRFETAMDCFHQALTLDPTHAGASYNRGIVDLTLGNYPRGFRGYEWRFKTGDFRPCPFQQPLWDGSDLKGKTLLLHAEQGLGDTIQAIRYAAIARQRGGRLILTCHEPLIRLLTTVPGIEQVIPLGHPVSDFQVYAPLMSLPHILGTTLDTVPAAVPYLKAPKSSLQLTSSAHTRLRVGLVWSGGHLYRNNPTRSCPLITFDRLIQLSDIAFYSLQKGMDQGNLLELGWETRIQALHDRLTDMAETAAAIAQLDLVITVDTSVAHLAGALGKPVWLLLSYLPDWRWMLDRQDSPWYPTMRLFRQTQPGDWNGVMERVELELQQWEPDCGEDSHAQPVHPSG